MRSDLRRCARTAVLAAADLRRVGRIAVLVAAAGTAACAAAPVPPSGPAPLPPSAPAPVATSPTCTLHPGEALVRVDAREPGIRMDVRYATANNFTGRVLPGYDEPVALLRPEAAAALARVHRALAAEGYGLKVFDGYRPIRATLAMVEWAESSGNRWVLDQGYVARASGHNRGGTLDLTLVRLADGREVEMGTPYDTFSEAAHTANATGAVAANRARLVRAMAAEGFRNYDKEWWHFTLPGTWSALDAPVGCWR